ncbi:MAG TPA: hypothetical protein VM513_23210 [Kofleriaceae bacterium]|nr:hypothetical protein [Kofleriaceae bacterium]
MRSVVALALLLAGCGDDLDLDRCLADGFADGEAMIAGEPLGPFVRAAQVPTSSVLLPLTHAFVFDEAAGACGEASTTGKHLVIAFCEQPTESEYTIVPPSQLACPGSQAVALVERAGGEDIIRANAGTITITHAGVCVAGTYTLTFGGDMMEGGFDVAVCP